MVAHDAQRSVELKFYIIYTSNVLFLKTDVEFWQFIRRVRSIRDASNVKLTAVKIDTTPKSGRDFENIT